MSVNSRVIICGNKISSQYVRAFPTEPRGEGVFGLVCKSNPFNYSGGWKRDHLITVPATVHNQANVPRPFQNNDLQIDDPHS